MLLQGRGLCVCLCACVSVHVCVCVSLKWLLQQLRCAPPSMRHKLLYAPPTLAADTFMPWDAKHFLAPSLSSACPRLAGGRLAP